MKTSVETQVADDEVHTAVTGEIARHDAIPPPLAALETGCRHAHEPPAAGVVEDRDGHPLAHDHEVGPAVAVHVPPHGVGHHPHVLEVGREPPRDVGEVPVAVVLEHHAPRIGSVAPRHDAAAHEEIDVAVTVVIGRHHPRPAVVLGGQAAGGFVETTPSVVQIEPVLERRRECRVFAASANDVEVGVPIAVGNEEHRAQVFRDGILLEQPPPRIRAHEPPVPLLDEERPRLPFRAADEEVIEPIAIHVAHSDDRTFGREHLGNQQLPVEIDEVVFVVDEIEADLAGDVSE